MARGCWAGIIYQPFYLLTILSAAADSWLAPQTWDWTRRLGPIKVSICLVSPLGGAGHDDRSGVQPLHLLHLLIMTMLPDREQQALREVGRTAISAPMSWALVLLFLLTIASVGLLEPVVEDSHHGDAAEEEPAAEDIAGLVAGVRRGCLGQLPERQSEGLITANHQLQLVDGRVRSPVGGGVVPATTSSCRHFRDSSPATSVSATSRPTWEGRIGCSTVPMWTT